MTVRIIKADVMDGLAQLADESVHCVVTSPPYFGLRDYGMPGQIGLEPTPAEFVGRLVDVFREVRRVLRSDGTCWLNMGDSYAGTGKSGGGEDGARRGLTGYGNTALKGKGTWQPPPDGLKQKDLILIPERLAIALQDDGWYIRARIIWAKPNPMPESVTDRPTKSHEHIWLMSKASRYFYDADAIKETAIHEGRVVKATGDAAKNAGKGDKGRTSSGFTTHDTLVTDRNARDVWTIATAPFAEAHFATFPPELAERCIKAGCPAGGTVLDPFGGSGTTGLVADRLQRNAVLIELNPAYAEMAERRLSRDAGMFSAVRLEAAE